MRRQFALMLMAALLVSGRVAQAQTAEDGGTGSAPSMTAPPPGPSEDPIPGGPQLAKAIAQRVERRLAELHRRLRITSAQQSAWDAFAQTMRQNAARTDAVVRSQAVEGRAATAVDDLRGSAAVAQTHADNISRLLPVFTALYDGLTPEQKRTADQTFRDFQREQQRANGR